MMFFNCLLAVLVLDQTIQAQTSTVQQVSIQQAYPSRSVENESLPWMRAMISHLDPLRLRPVPEKGLERDIVDAGKHSAPWLIRRHLGEVEGAYTLPTEFGDLLIARWPSGETEEGIWLWDSPYQTVFAMQVPAQTLSDPATLASYCEGLLVWQRIPIRLEQLKISLYPSVPDRAAWAVGEAKHTQQERGLFWWRLTGITTESDAIIAVAVSKQFLGGQYKPEALVHERFPPLAERIKQFSRDGLLAEIGKGYRLNSVSYPAERDRVIVGELLSRGVAAEEEVVQIILGSFDSPRAAVAVNSRLLGFLNKAEERKELGLYAKALERLCMTAKAGGPLVDYVIGNLFSHLKANKIPYLHLALNFAERGLFLRPSYFHLENDASDEETLQKLMMLPVRPDSEAMRKQAIARITERLQQQR